MWVFYGAFTMEHEHEHEHHELSKGALWQVTMAASTSTIAAWITMPTVVQRAKPHLTLLHLVRKVQSLNIRVFTTNISISCHFHVMFTSYHFRSY